MFEYVKGGMKPERERERERENWEFSPGPDARSWFDDPWNNKSERSEMYLYWSNQIFIES